MSKWKLAALLLAGFMLVGAPGRANATVVYTLSFSDGSTGTLDLNLPTIAAVENYNGSFDSILQSFTVSGLSGQNFTITPANLLAGSVFQTGNVGQVYTLTLQEASAGLPGTTPILWLFTNSAQIHEANTSTLPGGGSFTISSPVLGTDAVAAVPETSTWIMMLFGFAALGFAGYRKSRGGVSFSAAHLG